MSRVLVAAAVLALAPVAAARGEPISVTLNSATSGFSSSGPITAVGTSIDLGTLSLNGDGVGTFFFNDASAYRNYELSFNLDLTGVQAVQFELLDPLGDGDDATRSGDPAVVRAGWVLDIRQPRRASTSRRVRAWSEVRRSLGDLPR